ncbi:MAG: preprotein translocase subunit SecG [Candidatus Vogelbacteria bacterium]|nr:preprotein translocase subunit SecG [Candidatus Vogelbacteria bacterium]
MLSQILPWIQIILSVLLVGAILLQQSEAGLGGTFGGSSSANPFHTKRGAEKNIFIATIILGALFLVATLLSSYLQIQ